MSSAHPDVELFVGRKGLHQAGRSVPIGAARDQEGGPGLFDGGPGTLSSKRSTEWMRSGSFIASRREYTMGEGRCKVPFTAYSVQLTLKN